MRIALKSEFSLSQIIILTLLLLASMNVLNLYFYFLFAAFWVSVIASFRNFVVDKLFFVLLVLSFSYLIFDPDSLSSITLIIKRFIFPMCYLMGLNFLNQGKNDSKTAVSREKILKTGFLIPAIGAFFHYLLNMAVNINSLNRNTVDVWTGEIMLATGQACLAIMAIGVFSATLFSESSKVSKFISAVGLLGIYTYNLVLAGRTLIVLSVMILSVALIYSVKNSDFKRNLNVIIVTIVIIVMIVLAYTQDLFGFRNWILGSNLSARFDIIQFDEDSRLANKLLYFSNMLEYPFGGGSLRNYVGGYAHELYLDVYSDTGVLGYVSIIIFVAFSSINAWNVMKKGNVSKNFKLLLLCIFVSILAEFFLEPIVQGVPWMLCSFCFYSGLLKNVCISDSENNDLLV